MWPCYWLRDGVVPWYEGKMQFRLRWFVQHKFFCCLLHTLAHVMVSHYPGLHKQHCNGQTSITRVAQITTVCLTSIVSSHSLSESPFQECTLMLLTCCWKCIHPGELKSISRKSLTGHRWTLTTLFSLEKLNRLPCQDTLAHTWPCCLQYISTYIADSAQNLAIRSPVCASVFTSSGWDILAASPWIHLWSQMDAMVSLGYLHKYVWLFGVKSGLRAALMNARAPSRLLWETSIPIIWIQCTAQFLKY